MEEEGKETREYITLLNCTKKLRLALSASSGLIHPLFMKGLISEDLRDDLNDPQSKIPKRERTASLVDAIQDSVRLNHKKYDIFLKLLGSDKRQYGSIYDILQEEYGKISIPVIPVNPVVTSDGADEHSIVEQVPTKPFTIGNIKTALSDLSARRYVDLAEKLGLQRRRVEKHEIDWPRDSDRVLTELLNDWMDSDISASWEKLKKAVVDMRLAGIANKIICSSSKSHPKSVTIVERQSEEQEVLEGRHKESHVISDSSVEDQVDGANETPKYTNDDEEYLGRKPANPPKPLTTEFTSLLNFCDEVEIILHVVNKNELRAAVRYMEPPFKPHEKAVNNFPHPSMVVGMFAEKKAALVQTPPGNGCRQQIEQAIQAFKNAKYIIIVGVCYAFSRDKFKVGDVLVSSMISDLKSWKIKPDGTVEDRGETIMTEKFLLQTFCNDETQDPQFFVSDTRKSKVHSGPFLSSSILVDNKEIRDKFHNVRENAIGGEMEGGIVMEYQTKKKIDGVIIIKGVADFGDGKKEKSWQFTAAMAAFHFTKSKLSAVNMPVQNIGGDGHQKDEQDIGGEGHQMDQQDDSIAVPDGGELASSPSPPSSNPELARKRKRSEESASNEGVKRGKNNKMIMNKDELADWLINEGVDQEDVETLKELKTNERLFRKLHEKPDKLKMISLATNKQLTGLQRDLSSDLNILRKKKKDYKELADWLLKKQGIEKDDVDILKEQRINERLFMELKQHYPDELKKLNEATQEQIEELQDELKKLA